MSTDVLGQLRQDASERAGYRTAEVLEAAHAKLAQTRWIRLRKGKKEIDGPEEAAYVRHLRAYVEARKQIHRLQRHEHVGLHLGVYESMMQVTRLRDEMTTHRLAMASIDGMEIRNKDVLWRARRDGYAEFFGTGLPSNRELGIMGGS